MDFGCKNIFLCKKTEKDLDTPEQSFNDHWAIEKD
jgi:hypothetical protein